MIVVVVLGNIGKNSKGIKTRIFNTVRMMRVPRLVRKAIVTIVIGILRLQAVKSNQNEKSRKISQNRKST